MKASFGEIGNVIMTSGISQAVLSNVEFEIELSDLFGRYLEADFGDMEFKEDVKANRNAIKTGDDRIFATYKTSKGKVYIITEWDRSVTTILFPREY